jgi:hypothetical protein
MGILGGAWTDAAGTTGGATFGGGSFLPHATKPMAATNNNEVDSVFMILRGDFTGRELAQLNVEAWKF